MPAAASSRQSSDAFRAAARTGAGSSSCEPTWKETPYRIERRICRSPLEGQTGIAKRETELARRRAGRHVRVRVSRYVGIQPDRDGCDQTECAGFLRDCFELAERLDIERVHAGRQCLPNLLAPFADTGEDDPPGCDSGPEGLPQLAAGDDVRPEPLPGRDRDEGERVISLERVAERVRRLGKGRAEAANALAEEVGIVGVERRADGRRDVLEGLHRA